MEKTFTRVRSIKDIAISLSLVIAGSILIALPTGAGINIAGFFMIFAGIILILILRSGYRDDETGERLLKKEYYFQQVMKPVINSAISSSKPGSVNLSEADKGNAVRLDIYYSRSTGKAYLQTFEYIPYKYEPCSDIFEHNIGSVETLIK